MTAETDERHVVARKFLQRCGFEMEAILRKHKIVQRKNCNTALFVMLNSDWQEGGEIRFRKYLKLEDAVKDTVKVAAVDVAAVMPSTTASLLSGHQHWE